MRRWLMFNNDEVLNTAKGQWPQILDSLGINISFLKNKHGPCPACGGKDRFRFDDKNVGAFFCNNCGAGHGIKLLQLCCGWDYHQTLERVARVLRIRPQSYQYNKPRHITDILKNISLNSLPNKESFKSKKVALKNVWSSSKPITFNDPVDRYLQSRGMRLSWFPKSLRFHPNLPYYEDGKFLGEFEAMIALVQDEKNHGVTLHRTYLKNGRKANVSYPKKLMSPVRKLATTGASIKLFEPIDGVLAIAEGIETALSIYMANQIPVWASISAHGMEKIVLPTSVHEVVIAADNDKSGQGQKSSLILAHRLMNEGKKVKRLLPPKIGQDFNDILLRGIK